MWKKIEKSLSKNLVVQIFALPLHSLSGSNVVTRSPDEQDDPWKHSIQTSSTTPMAVFQLSVKCKVRNEKRTVNFKLIYEISGQYKQFEKWCLFFWGLTDIIYNEEFDPGSGWTLATGLTHASRGVFFKKLAFWRERPAHGWVTRIQPALHIGIASRKGD